MLKPSYTELMDIINQDAEADNKITSRYSIVIAAAKRARQIIDGAECDATGVPTDKAVSIAINEIRRGLIKVFPEGLNENETDASKPLKRRPSSAPPSAANSSMPISPDGSAEFSHVIDEDLDDEDEYFDDEFAEGERPVTVEKNSAKDGAFKEESEDYDGYDYDGGEDDYDDYDYGDGNHDDRDGYAG